MPVMFKTMIIIAYIDTTNYRLGDPCLFCVHPETGQQARLRRRSSPGTCVASSTSVTSCPTDITSGREDTHSISKHVHCIFMFAFV